MLHLTFNVFPYMGKPSIDGTYPLYVRLRLGTQKYEGRIKGVKLSPELLSLWNPELQRLNIKDHEVNHILDRVGEEYRRIIGLVHANGLSPNPKEIRDALCNKRLKSKLGLMVDYLNNYFDRAIKKNSGLVRGTKNNYKATIRHLVNYLTNYRLTDITLLEFNKKHALGFLDYLLSDDEETNKVALSKHSAIGIIKRARTIFQRAMDEEVIGNNPFKVVSITVPKKTKARLTIMEIEMLRQLPIKPYSRLDWARDYFLLSLYTGLAYADLMSIRKNLIEKTVDGYFIDGYRSKTNQQIRQFMVKHAAEIMEKYRKFGCTIRLNTVLPYLNLSSLNRYLKELAIKAGILKKVSSHVGRHTCLQHLIESGVENQIVIHSIMGWSNVKTISATYYVVTQTKLLEAKNLYEAYLDKHLSVTKQLNIQEIAA